MSEKSFIYVKQVKSPIGCPPYQRATLKGLGLRKRHHIRKLENTPAVRGMIRKVIHLVNFGETEEQLKG